MRIVALEEHFLTRDVRDAWGVLAPVERDGSLTLFTDGEVGAMLDDLSVARIARMDESGVDNAAGSMPFKPLTETESGDWRDTLDTDLIGPFVLIREMLRRGRPGAIVNVASIHALAVEADAAVYGAAKASLVSLTRLVALEGRGTRLRCNVVLPGAVETPMLRNNPNVASGAERIAPGELGQPADVAALVVYLASPDAAFVNGAAVTADGGRMAHL